MRALTVGFLVSLTACAGAPPARQSTSLVPLIKAERFDEAGAQPDLLAESIVAALREMKADGAGPLSIIRIADFFFDHYPFSIKDLPLNEEVIEAVAEAHAEADLVLHPRLESCARVENAKTLEELGELFESWHDPHEDGGRCSRRLLKIYQGTRRVGEDLVLDPKGPPAADPDPWKLDNLMGDLCQDSANSLGSSPLYLLTVFKASRLDRWMYQRRRRNAWMDYYQLGSQPRWKRFYWIHAAWLDALLQPPSFEGQDAGTCLSASRFDSRLRDLGRALAAFSELMQQMEGGPEAIESAARELIRAGRGTPFADLARYGVVVFLEGTERPAEAEAWLRSCLKEFDRPFRPGYALIEMTNDNAGHRSGERNIELALEALNLDPKSTSAITALSVLGDEYLKAGHKAEAMASFEAALALGRPALDYFEDESADYARSDAGIKLAQLLQDRKEWHKALAAWESVDYYSMCVLGGWDIPDTIQLSKAQCLDRLGRLRPAADAYWECVEKLGEDAQAAAKRLREIHAGWGTLPDLRLKVDHRILEYQSSKRKIDPESGLQWLKDNLGESRK